MQQIIRATGCQPILMAGLAAGMAEMLWVTAFSSTYSLSSATVARQITASFWPAAAEWSYAPALGIVIHLALSIALVAMTAPVLSRLTQKVSGAGFIIACSALMLALVWTVNFFIILPVLNPAFVTLLPYGVSLVSKLLFGVTMGAVLHGIAHPVDRLDLNQSLSSRQPYYKH